MKISQYSASRAQTAAWCDFKYHLVYEEKIEHLLRPNNYSSGFGNAIHDTLQYYATSGLNQNWKPILREYFNIYNVFHKMENCSKKNVEKFFIPKVCDRCELYNKENKTCGVMQHQPIESFDGCPIKFYETAVDMIEGAINRYDAYFKSGIKSDNNPSGKILGVEQEFRFIIGKDKDGEDILVNGYLDLVLESDSETIDLVDYKSGKSKTTEELMDDRQARLYGYIINELYPNYKYKMLTFDYFAAAPVTICFTKKQLSEIKDDVIKEFNEIKSRTTLSRRNNDWVCKYLCSWDVCSEYWDKYQHGAFDV